MLFRVSEIIVTVQQECGGFDKAADLALRRAGEAARVSTISRRPSVARRSGLAAAASPILCQYQKSAVC